MQLQAFMVRTIEISFILSGYFDEQCRETGICVRFLNSVLMYVLDDGNNSNLDNKNSHNVKGTAMVHRHDDHLPLKALFITCGHLKSYW